MYSYNFGTSGIFEGQSGKGVDSIIGKTIQHITNIKNSQFKVNTLQDFPNLL